MTAPRRPSSDRPRPQNDDARGTGTLFTTLDNLLKATESARNWGANHTLPVMSEEDQKQAVRLLHSSESYFAQQCFEARRGLEDGRARALDELFDQRDAAVKTTYVAPYKPLSLLAQERIVHRVSVRQASNQVGGPDLFFDSDGTEISERTLSYAPKGALEALLCISQFWNPENAESELARVRMAPGRPVVWLSSPDAEPPE